MDLPYWLRFAESLGVAAMPVVVAVGGIFAYYKFFRQGEHDPRLQPTVATTLTVSGEVVYVVVTASVQNNGQVDVELDLDGSALEAFVALADEEGWESYEIADVFEDHKVVQPGETLEDKWLIELDPDRLVGVAARLTVVEKTTNLSWLTTEMIVVSDNGTGVANADT